MNRAKLHLLESRARRVPLLYHGTSMEAFLELCETGILPTGDSRREGGGDPQTLYFCAVKRDFRFHPLDLELTHFSTAKLREDAASYAATIAVDHYVLKHLPFKPTENWSDCHNPEVIIADGISKGHRREELERIVRKAQQRRGVLLGLRRDMLDLPIVRDEDGNEADRCNSVKIYLSHGLPEKYLFSVQFLGAMERREMEQYLQK